MPYIRVIYKANKLDFDYVSGELLDALINGNKITHFYRSSEKRWINIRLDPIRGNGGGYQGPERRKMDNEPNSQEQKAKEGFKNTKGSSSNWLEQLWRHIENQ